jgi:DNA helicase HerA-like ATPase
MSGSLGVVIAREDSPSTSEFFFVVKNKEVKKGQYVQLAVGAGKLFGYVSEVYKANRYFERPESVAEFERGSGMSNFPSESWEHTSALVKILGVFNKGFERAFSPPSPGCEVFEADLDSLKMFLGFDENGMDIGKIEHHDLPARISMTRLLQKHFAILAMSGAGKSHLSSILLEEILGRKREDGRIAVLVVDIHGEYIGFAHDPVFGNQTTVIDGSEISVPLKKVSPETIMEWLPNLSAPQRDLLRHAITELKEQHKDTEGYSFKELISAIEKSDVTKDEVKRALRRSLMELKRYRFLSRKRENPKLVSGVQSGKMMILDFSTIDSLRKKQILVALLARRLFTLRKKGRIPPFLLLIEEAHNFAREKAEASEAVSRSIIETIAREGRKFGACLCLISQRPVNLSTTALSQCNTHIILRVTNPNDLDHIQMSSEGIDSRVAKSITGLKVGEAILVGEAVNHPVFVKIRGRKSVKREKGAPLHKQAVEFEEKKEKREKGVEAFV